MKDNGGNSIKMAMWCTLRDSESHFFRIGKNGTTDHTEQLISFKKSAHVLYMCQYFPNTYQYGNITFIFRLYEWRNTTKCANDHDISTVNFTAMYMHTDVQLACHKDTCSCAQLHTPATQFNPGKQLQDTCWVGPTASQAWRVEQTLNWQLSWKIIVHIWS
jgi:hypothetical protein